MLLLKLKSYINRKWELKHYPYTHNQNNEFNFYFKEISFFGINQNSHIGFFHFLKNEENIYSFLEEGILLHGSNTFLDKNLIFGLSDESIEAIDPSDNPNTKYLKMRIELNNSKDTVVLETPNDYSAWLFVNIFDFFLDIWNK